MFVMFSKGVAISELHLSLGWSMHPARQNKRMHTVCSAHRFASAPRQRPATEPQRSHLPTAVNKYDAEQRDQISGKFPLLQTLHSKIS